MDTLSKFLLGVAIVCFGLVGADLTTGMVRSLNTTEQVQKISNLPEFEVSTDTDDTKLNPLVRLEIDGEFHCSGTVISDKYVLTAAHCLTQGANRKLRSGVIKIVSTTGEAVDSQAAAINLRADYGLITGDFSIFQKAEIDTDPAHDIMVTEYETPLLLCGFPWGAASVCYGTGSPVSKYVEGFAVVGQLYPGMSGGPVVNTRTGAVVGVNSAITVGAVIIMPIIGLFETLGVKVK
jgi:Trypsin-like peptidase domain